jgi:septum formation protein
MCCTAHSPARLVLASASPRRREILSQLGIAFRVVPGSVDEARGASEEPESYARRMAGAKAGEVARRLRSESPAPFVLGADTIVVVGGAVLGKPGSTTDAEAMLRRLSGRSHTVVTAVALRRAGSEYRDETAVATRVTFRELGNETVARYAASGEGGDKAGSYAIQGLGAGLVLEIDGSYSNVVGLPAAQTLELLQRAGAIAEWPPERSGA